MADYVLFTRTGPLIPVEWALSWVISTSVIRKKDGSNVWIHRWRPGKDCCVPFFSFHTSLRLPNLITPKRDATNLGVVRTLSRIDRMLINLPMAEARDFHCCSHVVENLRKETIPSDHAAVLLVIQNPTNRGHQSKRIPSWMSKHPIFGSILQQLHDDHRFSPDPFCALAEFKVLLHEAKKMTKLALSRQTPDCIGAKLLITSTVLRAYRNRHLGTLMRCCEAWKPVEDCFDTLSFECIDFQRLTQIIANLTRESLAEREAEITNLPWTQKKHCFSQMQRWTTRLA